MRPLPTEWASLPGQSSGIKLDKAHQSLRAGGKVGYSHGERDARKLFDRWWLGLKAPISFMEISITTGEIVSIPHYKAWARL